MQKRYGLAIIIIGSAIYDFLTEALIFSKFALQFNNFRNFSCPMALLRLTDFGGQVIGLTSKYKLVLAFLIY